MGCNSPGATHHLACDCREAAMSAEIARLTRERDEAREALADAGTLMDRTIAMSYCTSAEMPEKDHTHALPSAMLGVIRERDEARERAASLSRELLTAIRARDSYRADVEALRDVVRGTRRAGGGGGGGVKTPEHVYAASCARCRDEAGKDRAKVPDDDLCAWHTTDALTTLRAENERLRSAIEIEREGQRSMARALSEINRLSRLDVAVHLVPSAENERLRAALREIREIRDTVNDPREIAARTLAEVGE